MERREWKEIGEYYTKSQKEGRSGFLLSNMMLAYIVRLLAELCEQIYLCRINTDETIEK
jgi:hypothetical protein